MLLEIFDFFCFSYFQVLLYPNFATEIFSYLHEKIPFEENVFEKQAMRDMNIKRNLSKLWAFRKQNPLLLNSM